MGETASSGSLREMNDLTGSPIGKHKVNTVNLSFQELKQNFEQKGNKALK